MPFLNEAYLCMEEDCQFIGITPGRCEKCQSAPAIPLSMWLNPPEREPAPVTYHMDQLPMNVNHIAVLLCPICYGRKVRNSTDCYFCNGNGRVFSPSISNAVVASAPIKSERSSDAGEGASTISRPSGARPDSVSS